MSTDRGPRRTSHCRRPGRHSAVSGRKGDAGASPFSLPDFSLVAEYLHACTPAGHAGVPRAACPPVVLDCGGSALAASFPWHPPEFTAFAALGACRAAREPRVSPPQREMRRESRCGCLARKNAQVSKMQRQGEQGVLLPVACCLVYSSQQLSNHLFGDATMPCGPKS